MLDKVGRSSSDTAVSVGDGGPVGGGSGEARGGGGGADREAVSGERGPVMWRPGGGRTKGSLWRAEPSEEGPREGDVAECAPETRETGTVGDGRAERGGGPGGGRKGKGEEREALGGGGERGRRETGPGSEEELLRRLTRRRLR